jgi:hypothetical protein
MSWKGLQTRESLSIEEDKKVNQALQEQAITSLCVWYYWRKNSNVLRSGTGPDKKEQNKQQVRTEISSKHDDSHH